MATLHMTELTLTNGKTYNDIYCELPYKLFEDALIANDETFIQFYYIDAACKEVPLAIRNSCIASYELSFLFENKDEADNFEPSELLADAVAEVKATNTCNCKCENKKDTDGDKKNDDLFFADIVADYADVIAKIAQGSPTFKNIYGLH